MALSHTPQDSPLRQLASPLSHLGDAGLAIGIATLLASWLGLAPGSWSLPAFILIISGYTITTIARTELRSVAIEEVVVRLSRSTDPELMYFRAELMQPARQVIARFWSGTGAAPASRCRWRVAHAACDGYALLARGERLCTCNCHEIDALGLTGIDHASLWLASPERFRRARRRAQRAAEAV